jgi:dTDP-4-amino-4,6-dideoxygalactose transaminase
MLERYADVQRTRNANHETLRKALSRWHVGRLPAPASPDIEPSWVRGKVVLSGLDATRVDLLGRRLCAAGFRSGRLNWGIPIHEHPAMARSGSRMRALDSLGQASALARTGLDVPIHQEMATEDVEYLASLIRDGLDHV